MATTKSASKPKKSLQSEAKKAMAKIASLGEMGLLQGISEESEAIASPQQPMLANGKIKDVPQVPQVPQDVPHVPEVPEVPKSKKNQPVIYKSEEQKAILTFQRQIEAYELKILPRLLKVHGIEAEQFREIVISEVKRNPKLLQAFVENPASMFASILAGAEIGLIPSELIGEFFLIPRNIKQANGVYKMTVTPLIGYKGLVNLILRSGDITRVHTEVVYEGDMFTPIYGLEPNIIHKPDFSVPRTADKIRFAYAVAKKRNGEYQFEVLTREQIIGIQKMSKYDNALYFNDKQSPNRWMEKKSAIIQLSKMIEKDYYSKKGIQMASALDGGALLTLGNNDEIKIIEGTPVKPTRFRDLYGGFGKTETK